MAKATKILAYIPARSGSKGIIGKNIKNFLGKPLIAYPIEQALALQLIDRVIVDTDSLEIAEIAKHYGAGVPFLRPSNLAQDNSKIIDSIIYFIDKLRKDESYFPSHIMILQTTSPLRSVEEIKECIKIIETTDATSVVTVCATHPKLYNLDALNNLVLVNGSEDFSSNRQAWAGSFKLNGSVFLVSTDDLQKQRRVITDKTKIVVCPAWRSIDVDNLEEWAMAECLFVSQVAVKNRIKELQEDEKTMKKASSS